jgi:hypothetical protein
MRNCAPVAHCRAVTPWLTEDGSSCGLWLIKLLALWERSCCAEPLPQRAHAAQVAASPSMAAAHVRTFSPKMSRSPARSTLFMPYAAVLNLRTISAGPVATTDLVRYVSRWQVHAEHSPWMPRSESALQRITSPMQRLSAIRRLSAQSRRSAIAATVLRATKEVDCVRTPGKAESRAHPSLMHTSLFMLPCSSPRC